MDKVNERAIERTRVIVRRLPPGITLEALKEILKPWDSMFVNDIKFHPGKQRMHPKPSILSYAYLDFKNTKDIVQFHKEFDGHVFRDNRGYYKAIIEYSLLQSNPAAVAAKPEEKSQILDDLEYQSFISEIEKGTDPWSISPPPPDNMAKNKEHSQGNSKKNKVTLHLKKSKNITQKIKVGNSKSESGRDMEIEEKISEKAQRLVREATEQKRISPETDAKKKNNPRIKKPTPVGPQLLKDQPSCSGSTSDIAKKAQQLATEARIKRQNTIK